MEEREKGETATQGRALFNGPSPLPGSICSSSSPDVGEMILGGLRCTKDNCKDRDLPKGSYIYQDHRKSDVKCLSGEKRGSMSQGIRSNNKDMVNIRLKKALMLDRRTNINGCVGPPLDQDTEQYPGDRRASVHPETMPERHKGSVPLASSATTRRCTVVLGELKQFERQKSDKRGSVSQFYQSGINTVDIKRDNIARIYAYAPGYKQSQEIRRGSMLSGESSQVGYGRRRDSSFGSGQGYNRMSSLEGSGSVFTGSRSSSINRLMLDAPWGRRISGGGHVWSATAGYKVRALAKMKKGRRRLESSNWDRTMSSDTDEDRKESLLPKWRLATRVIMMGRWMLEDHIKTCDYAGTPYTKQVEQIDQSASLGINRDHYLFFDPSDFKANKQMRMSSEARRILTKRPEYRTEQEIYYAMIALRSVPAIADYPVRMQMRLAQWGSFQSFDAKRIIVRENDPPYAFYFILYGTVVVCILADDKQEARTVCFLHRGDSFGELAIVNQSARQSTVIAKDYIEMLVISDEAYERIFMVGGSRTINDPDHETFMRGLKFLDGWPRDLLVNDPKTFVFSFFKRDAVLTIDTNLSNWIFIVKSGSVNVLKKLVKMKPNINARTGTISVKSKRREAFTAFKNNQYDAYIAKENIFHPLPYGPDDDQEQAIKYITEINITGIHIQDDTDMASGDKECEVKHGKTNSKVALNIRPHTARFGKGKKTDSVSLTDRTDRRPKTSVAELTKDDKADSKNVASTADGKKPRRKSKQQQNTVESKVKVQDENDDPGERRTFLDDLDAAAKQREHQLTEADLNPQFVHVRTLTKGSVFGLETLVFDNQPSMCLVSNGSECILLNKKFYREHCPPELFRGLRTQISPYPSDAELKNSLLTRLNWDTYKDATLSEVLARRRSRMDH
ncbi:uncharacterized protein LOC135490947 [Lineus longissimus]|uniref:uncharacterized protein LOC135490947 n=1 Tax=Lineus longissimus TaxID=88925 RepID=UPI00315C7EA4